MPKDILVLIERPPKLLEEEFAFGMIAITVPVRGYLLIGTLEPLRPGDEQFYLVHNDDLRERFALRDGPEGVRRFSHFLPMGQVTQIPVDCCRTLDGGLFQNSPEGKGSAA